MKQSFEDFKNFLRDHEDIRKDVRLSIEEEDLFNRIKPKAFDILVEAENEFFEAMQKLEVAHNHCETIEDIEKLTKAIIRLCK